MNIMAVIVKCDVPFGISRTNEVLETSITLKCSKNYIYCMNWDQSQSLPPSAGLCCNFTPFPFVLPQFIIIGYLLFVLFLCVLCFLETICWLVRLFCCCMFQYCVDFLFSSEHAVPKFLKYNAEIVSSRPQILFSNFITLRLLSIHHRSFRHLRAKMSRLPSLITSLRAG